MASSAPGLFRRHLQDQALEVFRPARLDGHGRRPSARSGVVANVSNLAVIAQERQFEPVIGKPGDGASPSCAIVDEYHEHKTDELYETMKTGMGARSQPLMLVITTAGSDISGPCFLHQRTGKILDGVIENDQRFGIIFGIDEGDDWTSEDALRSRPTRTTASRSMPSSSRRSSATPSPIRANRTRSRPNTSTSGSPPPRPGSTCTTCSRPAIPALTLEAFKGRTLRRRARPRQQTGHRQRHLGIPARDRRRTHYYLVSKNYVPQAAVDKGRKRALPRLGQ